jgi:hypothetical protein
MIVPRDRRIAAEVEAIAIAHVTHDKGVAPADQVQGSGNISPTSTRDLLELGAIGAGVGVHVLRALVAREGDDVGADGVEG